MSENSKLFERINQALDRSGAIVEVCRAAASRLPAVESAAASTELSLALSAAKLEIDRVRSLVDELQP